MSRAAGLTGYKSPHSFPWARSTNIHVSAADRYWQQRDGCRGGRARHSTDRLTYAVDDRVVVPNRATTGEYCWLKRSHSLGLVHRAPSCLQRVPSASRNADQILLDSIAILLLPPTSALSTQLNQPKGFARRLFTCILTETSNIPTNRFWMRSCRSADQRVQRRTKGLLTLPNDPSRSSLRTNKASATQDHTKLCAYRAPQL